VAHKRSAAAGHGLCYDEGGFGIGRRLDDRFQSLVWCKCGNGRAAGNAEHRGELQLLLLLGTKLLNSKPYVYACYSQLFVLVLTQVFSQYHYRNSCSHDEVRFPVEPLVGLLRHPTVHPDCARPEHPEYMDPAHNPAGVVHNFENKGYKSL
jgi:hypothetical protein